MPYENTMTKTPSPLDYLNGVVAPSSEAVNVVIYVENGPYPKWEFGSDWANPEGDTAMLTPAYLSQDDMRFGPRYYGPNEVSVIETAVAERMPLPEPPLSLG